MDHVAALSAGRIREQGNFSICTHGKTPGNLHFNLGVLRFTICMEDFNNLDQIACISAGMNHSRGPDARTRLRADVYILPSYWMRRG
jgi:hypothetical protein